MTKVMPETSTKSATAALAKPPVVAEKANETGKAPEAAAAQPEATADQFATEPSVQDRSAYHTSVPQNWDEIRLRRLTLATDVRPGLGWFEAVVTAITNNDLLSLRWRDSPRELCKPRRRREVALLFGGQ